MSFRPVPGWEEGPKDERMKQDCPNPKRTVVSLQKPSAPAESGIHTLWRGAETLYKGTVPPLMQGTRSLPSSNQLKKRLQSNLRVAHASGIALC